MGVAVIALGDGVAGILALELGSVDLILSDLPSGETAAAFDVPPDLPAFWAAAWRALKPTGQVVALASSIRFAHTVIASQPRAFRYDLVWEKSLAVGFLNSRLRPLRAHEFVLVFSRQQGTYHPQMLQGSIPIRPNNRDRQERATEIITESYGRSRSKRGIARAGATDRFPRSVVRFGSIPTRSIGLADRGERE